jgi:tetratricopeptide (TPR) repeat protein
VQGNFSSALGILEKLPAAHQDDLGVTLLKLNIYNRMGNLPQVESLLRKLIVQRPEIPAFRTQLINFLVANKRQDDAIKELRAAISANPADPNAEFELVSLLNSVKGADAARAELVARIGAGGNVFPYRLALAKLDNALGKVADSTALLKTLMSESTAPEDVSAARNTLAEIYVGRNDFAAAEPLISEALRVDSHNVNALRLRAVIRIDHGQIDDAIADLRSALNEQPQSPQLLVSLSVAYERSGSIELADKALFDATKASGFDPVIGLNYVAFLQRRGLAAQAENVLTDLANRNPNNITVLSNLANQKLARQDWVAAQAIADAIRRISDKNDIADQIYGAALSGQNKLNESIAALQSVYNANPAAIQPMSSLVNAYLKAKQVDKAEAFLQDALAANPTNAEALVLLGAVQLAKNDANRAIASFEDAIKQQPKNAIGYRTLAELYARQGNIDAAIKVVRSGLEQLPKDFSLRLALGGLWEAKGEYETAISEYESMLKDQPGSMIVANNLASLLTDNRTDKASLDRANSLTRILVKSDVPQFKDTLGWVAYQRGEYATANSLLEEAEAKLPNLPVVRYHLGMSYMALGLTTKASEQFEAARKLAQHDAALTSKIEIAIKSLSEKLKG